ncbi:TrkH family potassium uptake protein [Marinobacter nanhaiticus D15-8W]|uniref:Trk system potassium uptake protein n=2 Tax=Marinobacter TaxID=2742 RepID=N6WZ78_9GAMM|nr:TrkH family potassium uptake protein [Marinobacter nanhaiticus]ENO14073.2 TrkH family potassium uptake protein [Marinobacter nanhaiticus D15-8W]
MLVLLSTFLTLPPIFLPGAPNASDFSSTAIGVFLVGVLGLWLTRNNSHRLQPRYMFLLTVSSWVIISLLCALPLYLSNLNLSMTDAIFESFSGITTTGSTVLTGLDTMAPDILLWRSIIQWIGGIGIIGMFVAVLPFLGIGGMRLFATESSEWTEKALPRMKSLSRGLLLVYCSFTLACIACYWLAGMDLFNAINHAFTTISTGGYSTSDSSMGQFNSLSILLLSSLFMALGAMPFFLFVRELHGQHGVLIRDQQVRAFISVLILSALIMTIYRLLNHEEHPFELFVAALFNVTSIVTTTGYASEDYLLWGPFTSVAFFFLTFVGGCSGSTSGGMKIFRFQLSFMVLREQFRRLLHPRAVLTRNFNGRPVSDEIIASMISYVFVFLVTMAVMTLLLSLLGVDLITSLTGSITALTNVGPGLGTVIGPAGNFALLPDEAKWILSVGMILGRLELLSVIILFSPAFWRT